MVLTTGVAPASAMVESRTTPTRTEEVVFSVTEIETAPLPSAAAPSAISNQSSLGFSFSAVQRVLDSTSTVSVWAWSNSMNHGYE